MEIIDENKIIEGNKLIAAFMYPKAIRIFGNFDLLKYHSSWDWLMPVVEKIESLGFRTIQHGFLRPYGNGTVMYDMFIKKQAKDFEKDGYIYDYEGPWHESKIQAVWIAVVEFIEWYNLSKCNV